MTRGAPSVTACPISKVSVASQPPPNASIASTGSVISMQNTPSSLPQAMTAASVIRATRRGDSMPTRRPSTATRRKPAATGTTKT